MTAALLDRLSALGISARAEGDTLRLEPASAIPDDLLAQLRAHKVDLMLLLSSPAPAEAPEPETSAEVADAKADDLSGYIHAALKRPVSWADADARPSPGCFCSCCKGQRWWGDAQGWRCWVCHPPSGLAATQFAEVRT